MTTPLLPAFVGSPEVNRVYNCDALGLLQAIPTGTADLVFTDPPYNLGYAYDSHDDNMPEGEYLKWCYSWLSECVRVLKPTGSLFILHLPKYAISIGAYLNQLLTFQHWITWKAAGNPSNRPLMPEHYALLYYTKSDVFTKNEVRSRHKRCRNCNQLIADYGGKKHLIHPYGPKISDVWSDIGRARHKERGEHPCKLPDRLVSRVIEFASNPGDLIVDPFVGTGTTAAVARKMERQFIAGDLSTTYCSITEKKLSIPVTFSFMNILEQVKDFEVNP